MKWNTARCTSSLSIISVLFTHSVAHSRAQQVNTQSYLRARTHTANSYVRVHTPLTTVAFIYHTKCSGQHIPSNRKMNTKTHIREYFQSSNEYMFTYIVNIASAHYNIRWMCTQIWTNTQAKKVELIFVERTTKSLVATPHCVFVLPQTNWSRRSTVRTEPKCH